MKMLVLGAGLQGSACAFDLLRSAGVERVTIADLRVDRLPGFLRTAGGDRLDPVTLDAKDEAAVRTLMGRHDAAMSALPYYFNGTMARLAVEAGCHFADLGGNTAIVEEQQKLDGAARAKGLSIIPDCGLAPGMVNILAAEGIRRVGKAERVKIYVGGLPQHPEPPLNYQIVYSLEGALDYYTTPSWILRGGKRTQVEALSELEDVEFPAPIGTLEAFHTGGGISTMPSEYEGTVAAMEYKTLRYPGHVAVMKPIRELGLLSLDPVTVKGGTRVVPRDLFIAAVSPLLTKPEGQDLVALRVEATGTQDGAPARAAWQLIDRYDTATKISAMMRTTGFSLSLTGQLQVQGKVADTGVHTPGAAMPYQAYVDGLAERGIRIESLS